jgi:hypothetical protein
MTVANGPTMCAGCGRKAEPAGVGGIFVTPAGEARAYALCAWCAALPDRAAVLDWVEERIGAA